jgi:hypothetical protein
MACMCLPWGWQYCGQWGCKTWASMQYMIALFHYATVHAVILHTHHTLLQGPSESIKRCDAWPVCHGASVGGIGQWGLQTALGIAI